jgi:hypothetical protein
MLANFLGVLPILTPSLCALAFIKGTVFKRVLNPTPQDSKCDRNLKLNIGLILILFCIGHSSMSAELL